MAEITEGSPADIGLDWLFGLSPTNNSAPQAGSATNVWPKATPSRAANFRVDYLRADGDAVKLTGPQFAALLERLKNIDGIDILTTPRIETLSGLKARVAVKDVKSIVTGVETTEGTETNSAKVNYFTDKIEVGPSVEILPTLENEAWKLAIQATVTDFVGYDKPRGDEVKVKTGKPGEAPLTGQMPLPHFRFREVLATARARAGETIALRGPLTIETNKIKGGVFRADKTVEVRKRLYVFVTANSIPGEKTLANGNAENASDGTSVRITLSSHVPYIHVEDQPVSVDRLQAILVEKVSKNPDLLVRIVGDAQAPMQEYLKVFDAAKKAKVKTTPTFLVSPEGAAR
jgi:type II secretory pathway component GspD/PulD (secretin)